MPTYNDIAYIRVETDTTVRSRMPVASVRGGTNLVFDTTILGDPDIGLARHLWGTFQAAVSQGRAVVIFPNVYSDDGVLVNATDEIEKLRDQVSGNANWKLTIGNARDDGSDLVLTLGGGLRVFDGPEGTDSQTGIAVTSYADNHGSDVGSVALGGLPVDIEVDVDKDGTFVGFLPFRPVLEPVPIWVRRGELISDFSGLAITGDDAIESIAEKTVALRTAYLPILEDLDTRVVYGADDDGIPIEWRIVSTTRGEREMVLNLAARIV